MTRDVLNFGLVGCGAVAQFAHLPAFARTNRARLVALCDRAEDLVQSVGRRVGVDRLYTDFARMLSDQEVDAVLIALPDPLHVPMASRALREGKHVLVEKPLGVNSSECVRLAAVVNETGLRLQVGSMKRHDPGVAYAHEYIRQRVGDVLSVAGVYRDSLFRNAMQASCVDRLCVTKSAADSGSPDPKADRERYNLWTQGAHLFDTISYLGGAVTAVTVQVARLAGQSCWHGILEFAHGGRGHFELTCKSCGDWHEQYDVLGEHGSATVQVGLPFFHRPAQVRAFDGRTQQWTQPLGGHSNAYVNQLESFARSVLDDGPVNPNVVDGLAVVQILEACERSLVSGGRVEIEALAIS